MSRTTVTVVGLVTRTVTPAPSNHKDSHHLHCVDQALPSRQTHSAGRSNLPLGDIREMTDLGGAKGPIWIGWAPRPTTHLSAPNKAAHPPKQSVPLPPKVWVNMAPRLGSPGRPQTFCRQSWDSPNPILPQAKSSGSDLIAPTFRGLEHVFESCMPKGQRAKHIVEPGSGYGVYHVVHWGI